MAKAEETKKAAKKDDGKTQINLRLAPEHVTCIDTVRGLVGLGGKGNRENFIMQCVAFYVDSDERFGAFAEDWKLPAVE